MTRRIWRWVRPLLAVGILAALVWRLGTDAVADGLAAVDVRSVTAAVGIGLVTTVASAWRWRVVARGLGLSLPLWTAVADYYRGLLLNAVLPAGVLGDVHRAVDHGRRCGDLGRGVRAVVFERFAGQAVLVAAAVAVLVARPLPGVAVDGTVAAMVVTAMVAGCGLAAVASARVRRVARTTWADARAGLLSAYALPRVTLASAAVLAGHLALFVVAARAAGVAAPVGHLVALALPALLVMAVPVSIGGWGPREAFLAVAFGATGLGAGQGLTTAVVYGVLALAAAAPGVLVLSRRPQHGEVLAERVGQRSQQRLALAGRGA
ncbi:lysylphosphatidylglycerol synthase transmembrane domain-containing protein [Amycolatopsis suaedae]|uniref:Flippase-like domain-containing protein n=1 Tax=Amycolatopsis suaedae TaxID=2510978 RepID=A0A4Q7J3M0_9PSEU|nr:lysylphosphatidylglycerol synthase transmembrane domain-containing protein [Amycolatopsis suaedae]RZQ61222.1 flippase-like domain-containing protein [Amycolatopsis suaedae]